MFKLKHDQQLVMSYLSDVGLFWDKNRFLGEVPLKTGAM
jgi:hypothetical protein